VLRGERASGFPADRDLGSRRDFNPDVGQRSIADRARDAAHDLLAVVDRFARLSTLDLERPQAAVLENSVRHMTFPLEELLQGLQGCAETPVQR
jgi:hypothetical protein